jgi:hypothetical protein
MITTFNCGEFLRVNIRTIFFSLRKKTEDGSRVGIWQTLLISGSIGFAIGALIDPTWHQMLEFSQVIAGTVHYDTITPNYVIHKSLWSFWNQVFAFLLVLGFSERTLAFIASGLVGMFSFQGISAIVWSLCRSCSLAVFAPLFVYVTGINLIEVAYPIWLVGHLQSLGIFGLSYTLLTIGLLGSKSHRSGGFLMGMAPCVHASWAIALWIAASISLLWDFKNLKPLFKKAAPFFCVGIAVTGLSLLIHQIMCHELKALLHAEASNYYLAFIHLWDIHRQPLNPLKLGVVVLLFSLFMSSFFIWRLKEVHDREVHFILRLFVVNGLIGLFSIPYSWIPAEIVPRSIFILMPARWMNLTILVFSPVLLGFLGGYRSRFWAQSLLIMIFLLCSYSAICGLMLCGPQSRFLKITLLIGVTAVCCSSIARINQKKASDFLHKLVNVTFFLSIILAGLDIVHHGVILWAHNAPILSDRTNDKFYSTIAQGKGMILTGSDINLIQLRTRRPVLLDGEDLDLAINYFPATGSSVENILRKAYGVELVNPSCDIRKARHGGLLKSSGKELWESRTPQQWKSLGKELGVTSVVCYKDWNLQMVENAHNDNFSLYTIQ